MSQANNLEDPQLNWTFDNSATTISQSNNIDWKTQSIDNTNDTNWTVIPSNTYQWTTTPTTYTFTYPIPQWINQEVDFKDPEHQKHLLRGEKLYACSNCGCLEWIFTNLSAAEKPICSCWLSNARVYSQQSTTGSGVLTIWNGFSSNTSQYQQI